MSTATLARWWPGLAYERTYKPLCEECSGTGREYAERPDGAYTEAYRAWCSDCLGRGWTPTEW